MQGWRLGFLGIETIPPWLGEFEVEQFFRLSPAEIATVKTRRGNDMQLGLGLHIGFLRMSGRALNSTDLIHWRILAFLNPSLSVFRGFGEQPGRKRMIYMGTGDLSEM